MKVAWMGESASKCAANTGERLLGLSENKLRKQEEDIKERSTDKWESAVRETIVLLYYYTLYIFGKLLLPGPDRFTQDRHSPDPIKRTIDLNFSQ